ncbi:hypothetical protein EUGRSUZ_C02933 [Eucalyptus grandis]|uniref:Uncharacterized protein n=2 Tax=Eucalyptus grandis TaxID=71139 RepID=A0ACC3LHM1_EUCGR|nr:hypothetical protein EUGRSUZ_C02933 [Eucalyptus grandis]
MLGVGSPWPWVEEDLGKRSLNLKSASTPARIISIDLKLYVHRTPITPASSMIFASQPTPSWRSLLLWDPATMEAIRKATGELCSLGNLPKSGSIKQQPLPTSIFFH